MRLTENFHLTEFKCHNGKMVPVELLPNVQKLADNLQIIRDHIGKPIHITSAYRPVEYNRKIGSKDTSQHVIAKAADIHVNGMNSKELYKIIEKLIKEKAIHNGGLGLYPTFVHYDVRNKPARW